MRTHAAIGVLLEVPPRMRAGCMYDVGEFQFLSLALANYEALLMGVDSIKSNTCKPSFS